MISFIEQQASSPQAGHAMTAERMPLRAGEPLDEVAFRRLRQRAVLDGCKWDPQVGDVTTLASFPIFLKRTVWQKLAGWAEALSAEALAAEGEILRRPELLYSLGLPRAIRRLLRKAGEVRPTPAVARVMRFDFHFTTEGWRISEVNSDVPGGFTEGSTFTRLMAEACGHQSLAGDPIEEWSRAIAVAAGGGGTVALLSAPGFMEDHQVIAYLARHLQARNCRAVLAGPHQIQWSDGRAQLLSDHYHGPVKVIIRFYQGEWLAQLPRRSGWSHFFLGGATPVGNPGISLLSESKRFPLIWEQLSEPMLTWRKLLPQTCDSREADWKEDESWILKTAFCNNGDTVSLWSQLDKRKRRWLRRAVRWNPGQWLAQRRFQAVFFDTPLGEMHACIGVYTFNGKAAGAYTRITPRPVIDYAAVDAALLIEE